MEMEMEKKHHEKKKLHKNKPTKRLIRFISL